MEQVFIFFQKLFLADDWPARWNCGTWSDFHGWLYIVSDLAVWAAYFVIPFFLIHLINKRPGIPFPDVFWLFGAFILFCGLTHLIDAVMFWWPVYRLSGLVKFMTAIVSWLTIFALVKIFPQALTLKTAQEFNAELEERKRIEEQLNIYTHELELKNKELKQFAYIASHDLQEPLRTIANFTGLLKEECADKESAIHLNFIADATAKMQQLIRELLEFSRVGMNASFTLVDCQDVVREVLAELDSSIRESNASIHCEALPVVEGNRSELKRLFQNLISNAIKFRKQGTDPEISLSAKEHENEFEFSVTDNGIGIEEKHFDKLFIIFQRLHASSVYPGTGIGLAICQKVVTLHKGKIWLRSTPDIGSTFSFTLSKNL